MIRVLIKIAGVILFLIGAVTAPMPLPIGVPLMAIGLSLLISTSKTAVRAVRAVRARFPWLDKRVVTLQGHVPGHLGRALKRTDAARHHAVRERAERRRDAA